MGSSLKSLWSQMLADRAGAAPRVVLAEGDDPRVRKACAGLLDHGITPVLLGPSGADLPGETVCLPGSQDLAEPARKVLEELAARRGWDSGRTAECLADPLYRGAAMVRTGEATAAVAGALRASGDVIRAGLQVIGLAEGTSLLSSCFIMELPEHRPVAFADCAVVPNPDSAGLADIALSTSRTYAALTGEQAAVAMLSFSTHGSASHPDVDVVREATALVRARDARLRVDGDLQFDAAFVPEVGQRKAPGSTVAGQANVFVFPNLAAGNIGYKIAQRLGHAQAYGPVLQGLSAPMNDLSRGCNTDDVVSVAMISALQAD